MIDKIGYVHRFCQQIFTSLTKPCAMKSATLVLENYGILLWSIEKFCKIVWSKPV